MAINTKRKEMKTKADEMIAMRAAKEGKTGSMNNSVKATIDTLMDAEKEITPLNPVSSPVLASKPSANVSDPADEHTISQQIVSEDTESERVEEGSEPIKKERKKAGRKKISSDFRLTIAFRKDIAEYVKIAASVKSNGNLTAYVNALVEEDIKKNFEMYMNIKNVQNELNKP